MPLIQCPECKSRVSDQAWTCRSCGFRFVEIERQEVSITYYGGGGDSGVGQLERLKQEGWQEVGRRKGDSWRVPGDRDRSVQWFVFLKKATRRFPEAT